MKDKDKKDKEIERRKNEEHTHSLEELSGSNSIKHQDTSWNYNPYNGSNNSSIDWQHNGRRCMI